MRLAGLVEELGGEEGEDAVGDLAAGVPGGEGGAGGVVAAPEMAPVVGEEGGSGGVVPLPDVALLVGVGGGAGREA